MPLLPWMDTRTLLACYCLIAFVFSIVLAGMRRLYPQLRGVGSIALGFAFAVPGTLLLATRGVIPSRASILCGNAIVFLCYLLLYRGILQYCDSQANRSKYEALRVHSGPCRPFKGYLPFLSFVVAIATIGIFYYSEIDDQPTLRVVISTFTLALARALMAYSLYRIAAGRPHLLLFASSLAGYTLLNLQHGISVLRYGAPTDFMLRNNILSINLLIGLIFFCVNSVLYLTIFANVIAETIQHQAQLDFLTGALNRKGIEMALRAEIARTRRSQRPVSILLIDVDRFKSINDLHGHAAGDLSLLTVAQTIDSIVRSYDRLGRFGGDEFLLLLPETPVENALQLATRIREALLQPDHSAHLQAPLTLSIGITECIREEDVAALLKRADTALYMAKRDGRDCARLQLHESLAAVLPDLPVRLPHLAPFAALPDSRSTPPLPPPPPPQNNAAPAH